MPSGIYKRTENHKRRISGEGNPFYGRKHSMETKIKMRVNHKGMTGQKMPEWFRERMRNRTGFKNPIFGTHHSKEHKDKIRKALRGRYRRNGQHITRGYVYILTTDHPFSDSKHYVKRSHLVMEKIIGRYLTPKEIVHHRGINFPIKSIENKQDDSPENLELFTSNSEHMKFHAKLRTKKGVQGFIN